jgi:hypothetical protein
MFTRCSQETERMTEVWSDSEIQQLKKLRVDAHRSDPARLAALVEHFKSGRSIYAAARAKDTPDTISEKPPSVDFARKIQNLVRSGQLNWVLSRSSPESASVTEGNPAVLGIAALLSNQCFQSPGISYADGILAVSDLLTNGVKDRDLAAALQTHLNLPDAQAEALRFRACLKRNGLTRSERMDPAPQPGLRKTLAEMPYDWIITTPLGDQIIQHLAPILLNRN